ncbi:type II toxin-antitoxin system BrnA family antitoxin [Oleidesulfovibrio alaskensis]|uniref:type II toxin-antitoxin system BrnA family antitoxin n=1 Tax=Oleidesulfovibrio alaskensis TaxID=58180 RepID=UPI00040B2E6E|nr:hypothetical protein [Oleidesulfovibrio alaskensis]
MRASDFDKAFDDGKDISQHLDIAKASRPNKDVRRVNVDFPAWMVDALDQEAARLGITRQAIIKVWIARQIDGPCNHA